MCVHPHILPDRCANLYPRNTECDYSSAYITLKTESDLVGHGMTFTIGRGNDIVSDQLFNHGFIGLTASYFGQVIMAIEAVANRLVGKETEDLFQDMGKTWDFMMSDPQLRWSVISRTEPHCCKR